MVYKFLLLEPLRGAETASAIHNVLDAALGRHFGLTFDTLMEKFTFVADCASTMPCVVWASSNSRKVSFSHKWMGCILHQLNTWMKKGLSSKRIALDGPFSVVLSNLNAVKTFLRIFRQGNWNYMLDKGKGLLQEVETRFGTTHTVVEPFLLSGQKVGEILVSSDLRMMHSRN